MKQRTILIAALLLLVLGLFGCGSKEEAAPTLVTPRERLGMQAEV